MSIARRGGGAPTEDFSCGYFVGHRTVTGAQQQRETHMTDLESCARARQTIGEIESRHIAQPHGLGHSKSGSTPKAGCQGRAAIDRVEIDRSRHVTADREAAGHPSGGSRCTMGPAAASDRHRIENHRPIVHPRTRAAQRVLPAQPRCPLPACACRVRKRSWSSAWSGPRSGCAELGEQSYAFSAIDGARGCSSVETYDGTAYF